MDGVVGTFPVGTNHMIDTSVLRLFPKANEVREGKNVLLMVSNIKLDIDYFKFKEELNRFKLPPSFKNIIKRNSNQKSFINFSESLHNVKLCK